MTMQDYNEINMKAKLENIMAFAKKMNALKQEISSDFKTRKGNRTEYVETNSIMEDLLPKSITNNLFIDTAPTWIQDDFKIDQLGKEYSVSGWMIFSVTDVETGYTKWYTKAAGGKGVDYGQAIGASETYALRQFLTKTFAIGADRTEIKDEKVWVFNKDGEAIEAINMKDVSRIIDAIVNKTKSSTTLKDDIGKVLELYNKQHGTSYAKINGVIPKDELEDLIKFASAAALEIK